MAKKILLFVKSTMVRFVHDKYPVQAASLAYISLLSLVPLMTVSLSVLSAFPVFQGIAEELQQFIFQNFVASSAEVLQAHLQVFLQQTSKLSIPELLVLLATGVLLVFFIEQSFNQIWQIKKQRSILQALGVYWTILTLGPILAGSGIALSSYVMALPFLGDVSMPILQTIWLSIFPYLLIFCAFLLLYAIVPNCKVNFPYAAGGALVATILFVLVKFGFAIYIANFPTYRLLYGALAVIPIFLIWLYCSWLVILFGALISYELKKFWLSRVEADLHIHPENE